MLIDTWKQDSGLSQQVDACQPVMRQQSQTRSLVRTPLASFSLHLLGTSLMSVCHKQIFLPENLTVFKYVFNVVKQLQFGTFVLLLL